MAFFTFGILLLGLLAFSARDARRLPLTLLLAHMAIGVLLRAVYVSGGDRSYLSFWPVLTRIMTPNIDLLLLDLLLCMAACTLGFVLFPSTAALRTANNLSSLLPDPRNVEWGFSAIVILGFVLGFIVILTAQFGNPLTGLEILARRGQLSAGGSAVYAKVLLYMASSVTALAIVQVRISRVRAQVYGTALLAILVLFLLYRTGGRGSTLTILITFIFSCFWTKGWLRKIPALPAIGALTATTAIILLGMAGRLVSRGSMAWGDAMSYAGRNAAGILSGAVPTFDLYAGSKAFTDARGHDFGMQYINYFLRLVPREIWADKPVPLGLQLRGLFYGDQLSGVPPTVFGEFYIAGGYVALIVGCLLFGMALKVLAESASLISAKPQIAPAYGYLLTALTFTTVRSGLEISIYQILYFFIPLILIQMLLQIWLSARGGHYEKLRR